MEKVKARLRKWLGIERIDATLLMHAETVDKHHEEFIELIHTVQELSGRVGDLESAYPDYKKAKAEADEKKGKEIVPGFRPFSQRKRQWEAEHRKQPKQK